MNKKSSKKEIKKNRLIIEGHDKNPFVKFWNWGWGIYYKNPEVWNYIIVGGLTTVVSIGLKYLLLFTVLDASNAFQLQLSVIISWIGAVLFAYVANRVFVFCSKSKKIFKEIVSFFGGRVLTLIMEMVIMWFFVTLLGLDSDTWVVIFTLICQVLIMIFNYFISKFLVFKKESK